MSRDSSDRNVKSSVLTGVNATAQNIKTGPGYLFKIVAYNNDAPAIRFIQIFDAAAADVTPGTTVPKYVLPFSYAVMDDNDMGIEFDTGISVAVTTTETGATGATVGATITYVANKN